MKLLKYTDEHRDFRSRLQRFFETEVTPFVDQWEAAGLVPKSVWRKMGQAGFLCPGVSKAYGGLDGDFLYAVIVAEELAKTRHSGLIANLHSDVVVPYIDTYGDEELKRRYLPGCVDGSLIAALAMTEPQAGSDLASIATTAEENGAEVRISGSKTFISCGVNADLVVVAARDPSVENPYEAISMYVVESGTPGFTRGRRLQKMGFKSQDTAELFFSNCRIPTANRLGQKGMGFSMMMEKLQQERLVTAISAVAAAEVIMQTALEYCKTTRIADRPVVRSQAVQFALVEMATDVELGRTFVDKLVAEHVAGEAIIAATSMAKYWTTDMVKRLADRCLDLFGRPGMLESGPIARAWRDVRVMSIFAGTNEIMKSIAAKFMGL